MVLGDDVSSELQRCSLCTTYYHPGCWENPSDSGHKQSKEEIAKIKKERRAAKEKKRAEKAAAKESKKKRKAENSESDSSDSDLSSSSDSSDLSSSDESSSSDEEETRFTGGYWVCPDCVRLSYFIIS